MNGAIILLAAGSSSRLGQSKQLLKFKNETLLEHAVQIGLQSNVNKTLVILGANADEHYERIKQFPVDIIINASWQTGIGSSIKAGLRNYSNAKLDYIIIMVCDQPFVTKDHINKLIEKFKEGTTLIVASSYSETLGVPALFDKSLMQELMSLRDDQGAKKIIQKYSDETIAIEFPDGAIDIDTIEDYNNLNCS